MSHPEDTGLLVSFDVSFDAYRRQVAKVLERHGPRVLRSVYDVTPPAGAVNRLVERLVEIVEPSDHVVVVPYCPRCRHHWSGAPLNALPGSGWIVP
ncbi:CRISPR-associated endonuclease Cas2 [Pseudofrankia sp. BMG5.37]|uniref:CRISPR-associated endonuclease Cas2 n=1 Tax=Pseudofrankia sp. BMG5.37 TaxID=3050035 RepID=UPI002893E16A|nr:CRISPR-associated endonuclease Cas2 [Pseudofrankia sp. BMG5.37]MDT3440466.1 CRISPR-associated endonuclease Cas2 [Pseudofrankia sp. BMG5.37]